MISQPVSKSLSKLLNNLFEMGHFPNIWKLAHVTPIYKRSGQKNEKSNYRSISILPTLSKVCESVIHERLLSHCMENSIISSNSNITVNKLMYIIIFSFLQCCIAKVDLLIVL